jgi:phosphoenolpyruvate-protein kinase (PTS system EI component)
MVEVPSAALLADEMAARCDFLSIGTNDLTQYTLAADRGSAELSGFQDALHPAVLLLVRRVVAAVRRHGKPVAVCGEAAGDVQAALVFVGLGVESLSLAPATIPAVKAAIRRASLSDLQRVAGDALRRSGGRQTRGGNS